MATIGYLKYVALHKWFVLVEGLKLGLGLRQLLAHDLSKLSRAEFPAYVAKFYGPNTGDDLVSVAFKAAWQHHWQNNPHHWEYWANYTCSIPEHGPQPIKPSQCRTGTGVRCWPTGGAPVARRVRVTTYGSSICRTRTRCVCIRAPAPGSNSNWASNHATNFDEVHRAVFVGTLPNRGRHGHIFQIRRVRRST